jgi:hypothetical protein
MNDRDYDVTQILNTKILDVSDSLHKLADQFDQDTAVLGTSWLNATSIELQRLAWNSLFVSTTIDTIVRIAPSNGSITDCADQTTAFRQVDGLHVAVKYLAQSVRSIKTGQQYQSDENRVIEESLGQLADRLVEVVNECKPS